jgi:hypothetical protein
VFFPRIPPLGGLMTADNAAIGGLLTTRSEEVTDVTTKGLLPQLIDVLQALSEGQELLSRKIREATLEHTCRSAPVVETSPHAEPSDFEAPPSSSEGASPNLPLDCAKISPRNMLSRVSDQRQSMAWPEVPHSIRALESQV